MKTITLFTLLLIGFFGVITFMAKPEIIREKYEGIRAPLVQYFIDKDATIWKQAKEKELADWKMKFHLPADCRSPKTSLRELECRNREIQHIQTFEQIWANKVNNGWKPDGISN